MADGSVRIDTKLDTSKLNKQMGTLKGNLTKGFKSLASASTIALGGITTAIGLVAGASTKIAKAGDRVDKLSQKIGISRTAFQEWDFILSQSGASVEGLQMSVKTLSNAAAEARDGTAEYKDEFDRLGISVTDTNGKMKDQETLFNEVFGALSDMKDETQRTATASKLLGRSATELAPAMNSGADGIEEMRGKAHDLGLILKDETIDAGVKLTDSLDQLKRTGTALMSEFLAPILPYINDLIQSFIDMTKGADDAAKTFGTKMGDVIQTIIDKITEFLPKALTYGGKIILEIAKGILKSLPKLIEQVAYMLGFMVGTIISKLPNFFNQGLALLNEIWKGMKEIAPKIGTWFSGIVAGLEKQITDFWNNGNPWLVALAAGIAAVTVAIVAYKAALLASSIAQGIATAAQTAFNVTMNANPVGLVITAIGLLTAAIVLLIKNWDAVKAKVNEVWDGFNDFLENLLGFRIDLKAWRENIAKIFNGFVDDVNKTFGIEATSSTVFSELGKTLLQSFLDGFNSIKDTVKNAISGVFNGFVTTVEEIFGIKTTSSTVFSDIGKNLLQGFIDGFNSLKKEVEDTVSGVFNGIISGVKGILGIESPSKEFKEIAEYVGSGFIQGLNNKDKDVNKTAENVFGGIIDTVRNVLGTHSNSKEFIDIAKDTMGGWNQGVEDGKAGVIRTAESLGEDVVEATTEGASGAKDAGKEMVKATGDGIKEEAPTIHELWETMLEGMSDASANTAKMIKSSISSSFSVFEDLSEVIEKGGDAWKVFASAGLDAIASVLEGIGEMLAIKAAEAVVLTLFGDFSKIPAGIAATAGAAAAYTAAGFVRSKIPSYSVGGVIDRDQVATVHAGETILPKGITSDMRSAGLMIQPLGMGTQSQTIYGIINLDGRKVAQAVFKHTDENVGLAYTG